jgi:hypothetical protein
LPTKTLLLFHRNVIKSHLAGGGYYILNLMDKTLSFSHDFHFFGMDGF